MFVISDTKDVTPALLTLMLQHAGALQRGKVEHIKWRANDAFNSSVTHLQVQYAPDAGSNAPTALLLKLNGNQDGELEHQFYQSQRTAPRYILPIVQCYSTAYDPITGRSHLLLQDISTTHQPPVTRQALAMLNGVPSPRHLEQIADALAIFHAYWWQHPQIGTGEGFCAIRPWFRDVDYFLVAVISGENSSLL